MRIIDQTGGIRKVIIINIPVNTCVQKNRRVWKKRIVCHPLNIPTMIATRNIMKKECITVSSHTITTCIHFEYCSDGTVVKEVFE